MLIGVNKLQNYAIRATDGEIGSVHDAWLDDEFWILRYFVVDTARWLPGRKVLLTPGVLRRPDWRLHHLPVTLTREQVKNSPDIDTNKTVSRQQEAELHNYYGWTFYWGITGVTPVGLEPFLPTPGSPLRTGEPAKASGDPHLQSVRELQGYRIQASDGELGHVDDFVIDDKTWNIRYMVVATSNWLPGRKVLISPQWLVGHISWAQHKVSVILTRESIKNSPPYDSLSLPTRHYENDLHEHYGHAGYWLKRGKPRKTKT